MEEPSFQTIPYKKVPAVVLEKIGSSAVAVGQETEKRTVD